MYRNGLRLLTLAAVLCGGLLVSPLRTGAFYKKASAVFNDSSSSKVQEEDLHPFTHIAYLPAGADLRTIRFESAKTVQIPAKIRYTMDTDYCPELAFRDPGGSTCCPHAQIESRTTAYEVTYSFRGQPLASDDYGNSYFTFQVYFRPVELAPEILQALSTGRLSRAETASYFTVKSYREPEKRVVIDETRSNFCEAAVRDGDWIQTDPNCQVRINYKTITIPSDDIAVRIDPVSRR